MARRILKATDILKELNITNVGFDTNAFCGEVERIMRTFYPRDGARVHAMLVESRIDDAPEDIKRLGFVAEPERYRKGEQPEKYHRWTWERYGSVNWHVIIIDERNVSAAKTVLSMFDYKVSEKSYYHNGAKTWNIFLS